ncbi:MAG: hypothetical protein IJD52_00685 [Alphaproteobacteria bacterium]|nr:hypothetical protein [Alphaproteobacteria bacterium]
MKRIIDFLKTYRPVIIWTVCYVFCMWLTLNLLFNFNMFSAPQWHHVLRAQLRGFPGFVFGLLILSAIPIYVASTAIIIRTKKALITIPKPKIKLPAFLSRATPAPAPAAPETTTEPEPAPEEISRDIPMELRASFLRARFNKEAIQEMATRISSNIAATNNTDDHDDALDDLPIPSDFDLNIDFDNEQIGSVSDAPIFKDITFGDEQSFSDIEPTRQNADISSLTTHLTERNIEFEIIDDIVLAKGMAIASHTDDDFWIADTENWFAAGKSRLSPINAAKAVATKHNCRPALYLGATNIMDLENLISEWNQDGITIITDLSEL